MIENEDSRGRGVESNGGNNFTRTNHFDQRTNTCAVALQMGGWILTNG